MKLNKAKLIKATSEELGNLGYTQIKDTLTGAQGLFIKLINKTYLLSLGFTISRYNDSRFTASYYLSKTTRWASVWGDIPEQSYQRSGRFLKKEERKLYLDDEHNEEGVIDAWWAGDKEGVKDFIEVVKITEPRFLDQEELFKKIDNSIDIKKLTEYSSYVFKLLDNAVDEEYNYQFVPQKEIDNIPMQVFKAAERTLAKKKGVLNQNTVKALAADTWHQKQLIK